MVVAVVEVVVVVGLLEGRWFVLVFVGKRNTRRHMMASNPFRRMELDSLPLGITSVDRAQLKS